MGLIIDRKKRLVGQNDEKPIKGYGRLYTIHFPGGKQISKTRVLSTHEGKWLVAVTDLAEKEGAAEKGSARPRGEATLSRGLPTLSERTGVRFCV